MVNCHRAVSTIWWRSSSIFHRQPCKLAAALPPSLSRPALEIPAAEVPGAAGREGWKTATAGRTDRPEQKTQDTSTRRQRPQREAAINGWRRGEHARIHGRTPTQQAGIGSTKSGYGFAWSSADLGTETDTLSLSPSSLSTDTLLGCVGYTPSLTDTHTKSSSHRLEADIQRRDRTETPSDATVCSRTRTHTHGENG